MTPLPQSETPLLETRRLTRRFGGLVAVNAVDFHLEPAEVRCLIGPNGAGKTTFFNLITAFLEPSSGTILFRGRPVTGLRMHDIARLGVARTFQVPNLFFGLSVLDNVRIAAQRRWESFNPFRSAGIAKQIEAAALAALSQVGLMDHQAQQAVSLAHGQKKRLELAIALATGPQLLLLDEPTAGMTTAETREMAALIRSLTGQIAMIVVEHDIDFVRQIADRITVFHRGAILAEGSAADIEADAHVREIYLGQGKDLC